jgi:hypothetical protein
MIISDHSRLLIPLSAGAQTAGLTSPGLLKILKRTKSAIRDDGRWYVSPKVVEQIVQARHILGIERKSAEAVQRGINVRPLNTGYSA